MRKIYQLKKTSYWFYDGEKTVHYLENDMLSEEFYTTHKKAFNALINHLKIIKGNITNPYKDIKLFPREHFENWVHYQVGDKPITSYTKWELIEIEPW